VLLPIMNYYIAALQGHSQDFLKGVSKNSIGLPEQGSGGAGPSR